MNEEIQTENDIILYYMISETKTLLKAANS